MADPRSEAPGGDTARTSQWDREPDLVSLEIATWEHAARVPGSWGRADRVADLRRLLPDELTGPVYAQLVQAEALFLRRTEPIPPFRERLARDFDVRISGSDPGAGMTIDANHLTLEGELHELFPGTSKLNDVVPGWDTGVAAALGADTDDVARSIRSFADLGLPRGEFSVSYGYRLHVRRIPGGLLRPALATHRALLMGCGGPVFQPGPFRDFCNLWFG